MDMYERVKAAYEREAERVAQYAEREAQNQERLKHEEEQRKEKEQAEQQRQKELRIVASKVAHSLAARNIPYTLSRREYVVDRGMEYVPEPTRGWLIFEESDGQPPSPELRARSFGVLGGPKLWRWLLGPNGEIYLNGSSVLDISLRSMDQIEQGLADLAVANGLDLELFRNDDDWSLSERVAKLGDEAHAGSILDPRVDYPGSIDDRSLAGRWNVTLPGTTDDPLVGRLHQQARATRDQEYLDARRAVRTWRDAAYGLLAGLRQNLPAVVRANEHSLQPLTLGLVLSVGKGRKKRTVFEDEPTAGWWLRSWRGWGGPMNEHPVTGAYYLLYDGRLAHGEGGGVPRCSIMPDQAFLSMLRPELDRDAENARYQVAALYQAAGFYPPPLQVPDVRGHDYLWADIDNL